MADAEEPALRRLSEALLPPAEELLADYFDLAGPFAGVTFDRFGVNDSAAVGPDDLLAVSMLDVPIKPLSLRRILGDGAEDVMRALGRLPADVDLWDADESVLDAVDVADDLLRQRRFDGIGPVVASKLLSRKRPRLVPVVDSVVLVGLGQPRDRFQGTRRDLARWLRDGALQARLRELAGPLAEDVSLLRVLDVVLWMRGSRSRNARRVRRRHGLAG